MNTTQQVKAAITYSGNTLATVAAALGVTPQAFGQRLNRGALRPDDLQAVANAIGAEYISVFRFNDGTQI